MTKIVESIVRDENSVLTVSCLLENFHGISDLCLSVPVIMNRSGIREVIELPLKQEEIREFQKSAAIIRDVIDSLGI